MRQLLMVAPFLLEPISLQYLGIVLFLRSTTLPAKTSLQESVIESFALWRGRKWVSFIIRECLYEYDKDVSMLDNLSEIALPTKLTLL